MIGELAKAYQGLRFESLMSFIRKLGEGRIWQRIFSERLTEPLHLNLLSLLVAAFGSSRQKINYDLMVRHHNAFCILKAADIATRYGVKQLSLLEFGVAAGAGLLNMAHIARTVTKITDVEFNIFGFDTGEGMPEPKDYRDHPELYQAGDFPMDCEKLQSRLPDNTKLVLGPVEATVPAFLETLPSSSPIGYVVIDLDYYSSTKSAFKVFEGPPEHYLPVSLLYVDDIMYDEHNSWCGELLALHEFNAEHPMRKIERHVYLETRRIFRKAPWTKHVFFLHVLDHSSRTRSRVQAPTVLTNPYL